MIRFEWNGTPVTVSASPTTTLLQWLRSARESGLRDGVGTKEGCAEGDCGACTVAILDEGRWRAINACLVLLPMIDGRRIVTVEGIASEAGDPHPAQQALVSHLGSQCGYCTPGFVMSLFEACYRTDMTEEWQQDDQICGNLCRCTGYRPIRDALRQVAGSNPIDPFRAACDTTSFPEPTLAISHDRQRYTAPATLSEALQILHSRPEAKIVAGGTDLGLEVTQRHARFPDLLSLERLIELRKISLREDELSIGAAVPLTDLETFCARALPLLHRMLRYFGSRQIKHRATLGGNLCNASPIADTPPVLLALDARLEIASAQGSRTLPLRDFFLAYRKTALQPGEILTRILLPTIPSTDRVGVYKVSRRRELDISAVSACFRIRTDPAGLVTEARIAYGGMAATPLRVYAAEDALLGLPWDHNAVQVAQAAIDASLTPIDDHRGSAWFRRTLARNLFLGFYEETLHQPFVGLPDRHTATVIFPR